MRADASGVDPGEIAFEGDIVDEEAGFKIVGAVEDEMDGVGEREDIFGGDVGDLGVEGAGGIDFGELVGGGDGFGELRAEVVFVEEDLSLEVGEFDEVAIDESNIADARADKGLCEDGAERTDAADEDAGVAEFFLTFGADAVEEDLAAVAVEFGGDVTGHGGSQAVSGGECAGRECFFFF